MGDHLHTVTTPVHEVSLANPSLYLNAELSWLAFNERVLEEAERASHPLLERVRFLAIASNNLDEFFMTLVAGVQDAVRNGHGPRGDDALMPAATLVAIGDKVHAIARRQRRCLVEQLLPALAAAGLRVCALEDLSGSERQAVTDRFEGEILPLVTPVTVPAVGGFPHVPSVRVNLLVELADAATTARAVVTLPETLPRLTTVPRVAGADPATTTVVWLDQLLAAHGDLVFPGRTVTACHPFRVTRAAGLDLDEESTGDLLQRMEDGLRRRPFGAVTRLVVATTMPAATADWLRGRLGLDALDVYRLEPPLGLGSLVELANLPRPDLKAAPLRTRWPSVLRGGRSIFDVVLERDVLLHHPYDTYEAIEAMMRAAASDPAVVAIRQTIYRAEPNSKVIGSLQRAGAAAADVGVVVELRAQLDEENNVAWARSLGENGVNVTFGLPEYETHCKLALIERRGRQGLERFAHLSTGNYNAVNARVYSDLSLLTARPEVTTEVEALFRLLTGSGHARPFATLLVAPLTMRGRLLHLIEREIEHARAGRPAGICIKVNHLVDGEVIRSLYRASRACVPVELIVRGACALRPGVPGFSDRIRVTSIVGRFLEHARAYIFQNGGNEEVYVGSVDLMKRNLDHRIDLVFPIKDPALRRQIRDGMLEAQLRDTANARRLGPDGHYRRPRLAPGVAAFDSHAWCVENPTDTLLRATPSAVAADSVA